MKTPDYKTIQDTWEKFTPKGQVLKEDFCAIFEFASQSKPQEIKWLSSDLPTLAHELFEKHSDFIEIPSASGGDYMDENRFYDALSELQTRIKPVDTKTVDALEFAEWIINNFDVVNFGFPTEPTFRKKGAGAFDKLYMTHQLLNLYIESKK